MEKFKSITQELNSLIEEWEPKFLSLSEEKITNHSNSQNRTIRQILGHMVDSASNNSHRIIHLQYRDSPLIFPNYATYGNNEKWISIQNYQEEDWFMLVKLWKYVNLHIIHIINNVDESRLANQWYYDDNNLITLEEGILDYLPHFILHLDEISSILDSLE